MGKIYLNNYEVAIIRKIDESITNKEQKKVIANILKQEEYSRDKTNYIARRYRKYRKELRKQNKTI